MLIIGSFLFVSFSGFCKSHLVRSNLKMILMALVLYKKERVKIYYFEKKCQVKITMHFSGKIFWVWRVIFQTSLEIHILAWWHFEHVLGVQNVIDGVPSIFWNILKLAVSARTFLLQLCDFKYGTNREIWFTYLRRALWKSVEKSKNPFNITWTFLRVVLIFKIKKVWLRN